MFNFWKKKPPAEAPVDAGASAVVETEPVAPKSAQSSWREKLGGNALGRSLSALFSKNPRLDDALLDELETALILADVGVTATTEVVAKLRKDMQARRFKDADDLSRALRERLRELIAPIARPLVVDEAKKPFVMMVVGVNGVGKTTTIGKLARHMQREGARVMLAAGDTFRAAATAQLKVWGERNQVAVVAQGDGADPASVIYDALQSAQSKQVDVLIADTAGRLHTQFALMDELTKIRRVMQKLDPTAPHEVLQVIDGTTGQNALSQVRQFKEAAGVTGLAVTKLDGTAKGGMLFSIARELGIPVRYAGIGESLEDLRVFDADAFIDAIVPKGARESVETAE